MILGLIWYNLVQSGIIWCNLVFPWTARGVPLPHSNALQYYVKREKCKVNDVIFPFGCEASAIKT